MAGVKQANGEGGDGCDGPAQDDALDDGAGDPVGVLADEEHPHRAALRRLPLLLKVLVGPSWGSLAALVLFQALAGATPSLTVWLNAMIVDEIAGAGPRSVHELLAYSALLLAALVVLLNALGDVLEAMEGFVGDSFKDRVRRNVSLRINEEISKQPLLTFFDEPRLNHLVILARRSLSSINELVHTSSYTLMGVLGMVPALVLAASLRWWIPLVVVSSMTPVLYAKATNERKSWDIETFHAATFNRLQLGERILTQQEFAKDLRLFSMQEWVLRRWSVLYEAFLRDLMAVRRRGAHLISIWSLLSGLGMSVPFVYVVKEALNGGFTVGDVSLLIGVIVQIRNGLAVIIYNGGDIIGALLATKPLIELLNLPEPPRGDARPEAARYPVPGIRLEGVSLRYAGSAELALRDVNLLIARGEKIAVVGENGSGKSTLVKLICGFYRPTSGQIQWDGAAANLDAGDGRGDTSRICAVFQDFARFPLSVRENVDVRQTGASDDDIRSALKRVGLDDLAGELDTVLWKGVEGGTELSGGEWQRLAIARALLNAKTADLLIFDEPTSAIDPDAEHHIIQLIREMMGGKTSIVVSHRLALTRFVDRIVVLEKGRILEAGSHRELMGLKGKYHEMFTKQASYYVD
ncbi:hypothetical protein BE04_22895 [Sorangium cellulosum]|uniref:ABC transporter ATP-binding protein n=1 Tax=Sorangium cellulosum TaxID=56 RepID=A0A150P8T4_SORCE|nr:hypothetical protein BE04_22895 [Sorangium cellulosum]